MTPDLDPIVLAPARGTNYHAKFTFHSIVASKFCCTVHIACTAGVLSCGCALYALLSIALLVHCVVPFRSSCFSWAHHHTLSLPHCFSLSTATIFPLRSLSIQGPTTDLGPHPPTGTKVSPPHARLRLGNSWSSLLSLESRLILLKAIILPTIVECSDTNTLLVPPFSTQL
jgi:hypothetical protein